MDFLDLAPIRWVRGTVRLPGSKSISNRILLLAALARGETRIHDLLESDDTQRMLEALRTLGIEWQLEAKNRVRHVLHPADRRHGLERLVDAQGRL